MRYKNIKKYVNVIINDYIVNVIKNLINIYNIVNK